MCLREGEKISGKKPIALGRSVRSPKKLRDVRPKYPDLPPNTVGRGMWVGEALIDASGLVAWVWPIRQVHLTPAFPAFNEAIADAIEQWRFEPTLVKGQKTSVCMTVSVNINWR